MRARKKKNGASRLTALSSLVYTDLDSFNSDKGTMFLKERPIRLEIGCGKGGFIIEMSKAEKDFNYIALEKVPDVLVTAVEKYAESLNLGSLAVHGGWAAPDGHIYNNGEVFDIPAQNKGNVRFFLGDASFLEKMFDKESIDRIYLNFSDPWPRNRHENRRLTHIEFLKKYFKILSPGGKLIFKTDNREFFEYSVASIEKSDFAVESITRDLHNSDYAEGNIETEYEKHFSSIGTPINMISIVKPE